MLRRISIPTAVSVAAILLAAIAVIVQLPPLLGALLSSPPDGDDPGEVIARFVEEHEENQQIDLERFNGRSLFYPPRSWPPKPRDHRPVPPERPKPTVTEAPPVAPGPPPTPTVYQGPSVNFALGSEIWFMGAGPGEDPFRVRLGEEKNGVKVISTDLPWSVTLGYRGGEFDIDLLEKGDVFISSSAPEISGSTNLIRTPTAEELGETVATDAESGRAGEDDGEKAGSAEPKPRNPLRPTPVRAETAATDKASESRTLPLDRIRRQTRPTARPAKGESGNKSLSDASDASDKNSAHSAGRQVGDPAHS